MDSDLEEEMDVDDPEPIDDLDLIHAGNEQGEGDGGHASGNENNDGENEQENNVAEGAVNDEANPEPKEKKKKRVILNPQPKIDYHRLTGKRGLGAMAEVFNDINLKGKGHEHSDLNRIMTKLEIWTHRLFPRYNFDEVLTRIERLGGKKQVQVYIKRMRLGMEDVINPISKEFIEDEPPSPPSPTPEQSMDDAFDSLFTAKPAEPDVPVVPAATPKPTVEISAEQRERMERNRQLALERRLARIEAQKEEERRKASENAAGPSGIVNAGESSSSTSMPEHSEVELAEENLDSGVGRENLFECSQEVSSVSQPTGHTSLGSSENLNDPIEGHLDTRTLKPLNQSDDPESPPNETDLCVGKDSGKLPSNSDDVSAPELATKDSHTISEKNVGEIVECASEIGEKSSQGLEDP